MRKLYHNGINNADEFFEQAQPAGIGGLGQVQENEINSGLAGMAGDPQAGNFGGEIPVSQPEGLQGIPGVNA